MFYFTKKYIRDIDLLMEEVLVGGLWRMCIPLLKIDFLFQVWSR